MNRTQEMLVEIIERLVKIEKDTEYARKHLETLNHEHGELVKRIEALEKKDISLRAYWKVITVIVGSSVTLFGILVKILEIIGVI